MKILMLTTFVHPDKFGGAERVIFELARHLAARKQEVTVLTHRAAGTLEAEILEGFRVLRYPANPSGPFAFYISVFRGVRAAMKKLLAAEPFDILHTHQLLSAAAAYHPRPLFRGPSVATFHAPYHQEYETKHLEGRPASQSEVRLPLGPALVSRILKRGDRSVLERAGAVIVLSRFMRSQVIDLLGRMPGALHVIPGGVDLDQFRPQEDRESLRRKLNLPHGIPVLFSVRRLVERMGLEDLIDAAAALARRGIPFHLVLGGAGPLGPSLEARAERSDARDCIRFPGPIPDQDLPGWYGASDLFVLPTRALEGFGMVTLEAMACGIPVAGTRAGATAEILDKLDPGLLFEEPGPEAMAGHLERLLSDRSRLTALGGKAREIAEAEYGWPLAAERTLAVYREALGEEP